MSFDESVINSDSTAALRRATGTCLLRCILGAGVWALTAFPLPLLADERVIEGLAFEVDEISSVDSQNSRVVLFGTPRIVPNAQVDQEVLAGYVAHPSALARYSVRSLEQLTTTALQQNRPALAAWGLLGILQREEVTPERGEQIVQELANISGSEECFALLLQNAGLPERQRPAIISMLAVEVVRHPQRVREHHMGRVLRLSVPLKQRLHTDFINALKLRDDTRANQLAQTIGDFFGNDDPLYRQLRLVDERLGRFQRALENDDLEGMEIVMQAEVADEQLNAQLRVRYVEGIHEFSRRLLEKRQPVRVLNILSTLDLSLRTPSTHELLQRTLGALRMEEAAAILAPRQRRFLTLLSRFDAGVRESAARLIEQMLRVRMAAKQIEEIEVLFELLLAVRPDPNAANDRLRVDQVLLYMETQRENLARARLSEIRSSLSIGEYLRLLQGGLYGRWWVVVLMALLPVMLGSLFLIRRQRREAEDLRRQENAESENTAETGHMRGSPRFNVLKRQTVINPYLEEYARCLEIFELRPESSLQVIKTAYRQAVKKFHPDRQLKGNEEIPQTFIDLTQTYQRILDLRKKMGLPDD